MHLAEYNPYRTVLDVVAHLPDTLATERSRLGLSTVEQAAQIGIGVDTLARLGPGSTLRTTAACLNWLAGSVAR